MRLLLSWVKTLHELERSRGAKINLHARLVLELMHKLGVHLRTSHCERVKCSRRIRSGAHQHASGGPGRLASRFAFFDYKHAHALFAQLDRQRKPDNACTDYDGVRVLHGSHFSGWLL